MLLQISQPISQQEWEFLTQAVSDNDALLVSGQASFLALSPKPLNLPSYIDKQDMDKIGGQPHSSWQLIDTQQWLALTQQQEKVVSWS